MGPIEVTVALVVDALLLALIAYKVFTYLRGTRAVQLLKGLLVLVVLTGVAEIFGLGMLKWTLEKVWVMAVVAIPVIFQPELRSMLEKLGRGRPFAHLIQTNEQYKLVISEVVQAVQEMSSDRIGALIVLERKTGLKEYVETGVPIDGLVSRFLLIQVFKKETPLHDGAVIIRGNRMLAASCYLPLTPNPHLPKELGTRHRAALGVTEQSDAISVVVSEETGTISVAEEGSLTRFMDPRRLGSYLESCLIQETGFNWKFKDRNQNRSKSG